MLQRGGIIEVDVVYGRLGFYDVDVDVDVEVDALLC